MAECIFCRIQRGELGTEMLYEDDDIVAFRDVHPKAPVHVLVVTRMHIESLSAATEEDTGLLGRVLAVGAQIARDEGVADSGYRVITNVGADSGQEVRHLHFHVLGGEPLGRLVGGI